MATKVEDPREQAPPHAPARPTEPASPKDPTPVVAPPSTQPTVAQASPLRPIALRKDPIKLFRQHDAPLLVLDGEPLTFVDGAFVRHSLGRKGLSSSATQGYQDPAIAAVSLPEPLGTWVTSGFGGLRYGPKYLVHHREQAGWKQLALGKGIILAYYAAYAERDGALLALRSWAVDPDQEEDYFGGSDEYAERFPGKLAQAEARAKQAWIRLAGTEVKALPEIPAGMRLEDGAITTADGTLWALAVTPASAVVDTVEPGSEDFDDEDAEDAKVDAGEPPQTVLLMWPPGEAQPERVDVPDLAGAKDVSLQDNGDWVIIAGMTAGESYLALGRGKQWQRVPVSLPADVTIPSPHIQGAARLPDGELWIALGALGGGESGQPLWRRPVDGAWQPVAVPEVPGEAFVTDEWERGYWGGWVRPQHPTGPVELGEASDLIWAAGAIWVVLGPLVDVGVPMDAPRHAVVLTTHPGEGPPAVLIPAWKQALEDQDHARPGTPGQYPCSDFSLVLGPGSLAGPGKGETVPAFVEKIASLEVERDPGDPGKTIRSIHLGRYEGTSVVVAEANANSPKKVATLRDAAAKIMAEEGVAAKDITTDCRVVDVERMLHEPEVIPR